jgi:hypothetical protein
MWVRRTWQTRANLLRRWLAHSSTLHPSLQSLPLSAQMALFLQSTKTSAATKRTYGGSLRSLAHHMGHVQTPVLDLVMSGLAVESNEAPIKQAVPITPEQLNFLADKAWQADPTGRLSLSLYIAWKTASRWSDVTALTKENFIEFDHQQHQVVIQWGRTKTNRREKYRASMVTVLQDDDHPATLHLLQRTLRSLTKTTPLCPFSTSRLRAFMRRFPETATLTAHSIKRGALEMLAGFAASGQLPARLIPLLAKHKDALHDFPAATLRYINSKAQLGRMLRTQDATRLL